MTDRALVTGGANGIGRAIVERLAADGYDCIAFDRASPPNDLPATYAEVDLSDRAATAAALAKALQDGPITRLVNNVGVVRPGTLEEASEADFEAAVSLNLRCALQCTQALVPGMKAARFGRIVNISSRAALGKELRTVYSATKAGLHGFAKTWALELGAVRDHRQRDRARSDPHRAVRGGQSARQPAHARHHRRRAGQAHGRARRHRQRRIVPARCAIRLRDGPGAVCVRRHDGRDGYVNRPDRVEN